MIVLYMAMLIPFFVPNFPSTKTCSCKKVENWERAQGGWMYPPITEKNVLKSIRGEVHNANREPMADVLVEVLNNPDALLERDAGPDELAKKQKRLAACKTQKDGHFCFTSIPSGRYELRYTKDSAYETKSIIVTIAPTNRKSSNKKLSVLLQVSH